MIYLTYMSENRTIFKTLPWESMPSLGEAEKEFISLSQWSLYRIQGRLLLIIPGGCRCCHGDRETSYIYLDESGKYESYATQEFYKSGELEEIIKFEIPSRITDRYFKIKM